MYVFQFTLVRERGGGGGGRKEVKKYMNGEEVVRNCGCEEGNCGSVDGWMDHRGGREGMNG